MGTTVRTAVVVAVLGLVVAMAGCGRGDGTEQVAVVRDLDLLEGAEAAGTARVSFHVDVEMPPGFSREDAPAVRMTSEGEGVIGFTTEEARWSGSWRMESTPPEGAVDEYLSTPAMQVEVIDADGGGWSRTWTEGEEPPAWRADHLPEDADEDEHDGGSEGDGGLLGQAIGDPTAFLDHLREEAATVVVVGEEEVRGDAATRYRAEIDAEALSLGGEGAPGDVAAVDVWIDEQDRLRRVEAEGMELELWDFGTPVDVSPPADVADDDDLDASLPGESLPTVTGDWVPELRGTAGAVTWTIWAAPAEIMETATTCRTLEVDGAEAGAGLPIDMEELPFPNHGGAMATCGNGVIGAVTSGFVVAPAVQVLSASLGLGWASDPDGGDLVGVVVDPEHQGDGTVTLVRRSEEPVRLALDDAGIAVWDGAGSSPITAIELDGGAVRCTFPSIEDDGSGEPGVLGGGVGLLPPVCVRA